MNLEELEFEFRMTEQDAVRPYLFPSEEIATWATQAEEEAAVRANLIRDQDEFNISVGVPEVIDLSALLYDIQYVECRAADGTINEVVPMDRGTLNADRPGWRTNTNRPQEYIHDDKQLIIAGISDADYTIYIEFFRRPKRALVSGEDTPEIAATHHLNLLDWVRFRAYSKPDPDTYAPEKGKAGEERFSAYFGKRKTSDLRRAQNAVVPHRNRVHL